MSTTATRMSAAEISKIEATIQKAPAKTSPVIKPVIQTRPMVKDTLASVATKTPVITMKSPILNDTIKGGSSPVSRSKGEPIPASKYDEPEEEKKSKTWIYVVVIVIILIVIVAYVMWRRKKAKQNGK